MAEISGVLLLDKPLGISSNQALSRLKKLLGVRKVGYIGTLDPLASGVLPVFIGKATKLISFFEDRGKIYQAQMELGRTSDSLDLGTETRQVFLPELTEQEIRTAIDGFVGEIEQTPPAYSAIRVEGQRSYNLARRGESVELPSRRVTIKGFEDVNIKPPIIEFTVSVSKGTYIRKLAEDIANRLGTKALLTSLRRVAHGEEFTINKARTLDEIKNIELKDTSSLFLSPSEFIIEKFATIRIETEEQYRLLRNGQQLTIDADAMRISRPVALTERQEPYRTQCFVLDALNAVVAAGDLEFSRDLPIAFKPRKMLI